MITITRAYEIIDCETFTLGTEKVPLSDAVGHILGEGIIADSDLPPFDRSQMDGYAVSAADTIDVPAELRLVGESAAGRGWKGNLRAGEAVRIMTGAPVPAGADAVQKLELATETNEMLMTAGASAETADAVRILESVRAGKFIVKKGAEIEQGLRVFASGEAVTANMVAGIAAFGYAELTVGRQPQVAVLSTGSEIVPVDEIPRTDQIRNSNSPMITALVRSAGGVAAELPLVGDDSELLESAISHSLDKSDILVITGGVSVGKYDLTKDVLRSLGAEIFFEKVNLKPGKPTVFGRLNKTLIFGLPGNPVSAAVTFHLFVRRAMSRMQGAVDISLRTGFAVTSAKVKGAAERDTFLPALVGTDESGITSATPLKWLGSSDFIGFARADSLIFIPAGKSFNTGEVVQIYRI